MTAPAAGPYEEQKEPTGTFPPTFYYANAIELFERLAFYGFYIGLVLYLTNVVGFADVEAGILIGNFRFIGAMAPIFCGAVADKITFKRSLIIAFVGYAAAYGSLLAFPTKSAAYTSLMVAAVSGGFMKPVITATVIRTSPPGMQTKGFSIFYRMINSGSVIGKSLAYLVRRTVALRFVTTTSVIASLIALGIAVFAYKEPADLDAKTEKAPLGDVLKGYGGALSQPKIVCFLLIFSGFYFMSEQFYMTFPTYVTRHIDKKAPLEIITLVNPALIAIGQLRVSKLMKRVPPILAMTIGVLIASSSMLVMGAIPTLVGACLSGAIYAVAEMTFSPRFYEYLGAFAPKGKAGLYMGLAFIPFAIGGWSGGQASGRLIARYLPVSGPHAPFTIWSIYAGLGLACATLMLIYGTVTKQLRAERL